MSTAKSKQHPAPDLDASQPFVGALLRLCWTQVWRHIHQSLKADGFTDLSESHLPFFRYPGPDASRPSDLARRLQVSRQVVNHGIAQLEKLDYLERRFDPESGRRLVYLTKRGRQVMETILASLRHLHKQWERKIGRKRFADFMDTLRILSRDEQETVFDRVDAPARGGWG